MPKRARAASTPEMTLDHGSAAAPLYRQLYERLRAAILTGQVEAGARLPSTRALASELGVSRTTTALVYQQLLMEGYLESRVGDGTRVSQLLPRPPADPSGGAEPQRQLSARLEPHANLSQRGRLILCAHDPRALYDATQKPGAQTFRVGQPDTAPFPYDLWARLLARRARLSLPTATLYREATGYLPLREAIALHIGITRGVRCAPEQVIITAGSQGALDLAARVLLDPGDTALIEDPGYSGARGALLAAGAHVVPTPVEGEGVDLATARALAPQARLISVTPSHQFPTGVTMSLNRRLVLLDWAREANAWILEDDYDSEFRFSGRPLEALQGLDNGQRVIYIGTFSKALFPALRLGYVVAPLALVEGFAAMRSVIDAHSPILEQMALADFMTQGHYARHVRHMRALYSERRAALLDALHTELGDLLEAQIPEAGMHLVAWLPPGLDDGAVADLAARQGIPVTPVSRYASAPLRRGGLIFGYATASSEALRADVRRLAQALRPLRSFTVRLG